MKTVDMTLPPAEAEKETVEAAELEKPKYPWGLCIYLNEDTMKMLSLKKLDVGTVVMITGKAKVTGYSEREYEGGAHKTQDMQIIELGIEAPKAPLAQSMYGSEETK